MKLEILGIIIFILVIVGGCLYLIPIPEITTKSVIANKPVPLASGSVLEQKVNYENLSTIKEIQIQFGTYRRTNIGTLKVVLWENDNTIAQWEMLMENLEDNKFQSFKLGKPVKINKSADYVLKISEIYEGKNTVAVWSNNTIDRLKVNDKYRPGTICYKIIGRD